MIPHLLHVECPEAVTVAPGRLAEGREHTLTALFLIYLSSACFSRHGCKWDSRMALLSRTILCSYKARAGSSDREQPSTALFFTLSFRYKPSLISAAPPAAPQVTLIFRFCQVNFAGCLSAVISGRPVTSTNVDANLTWSTAEPSERPACLSIAAR